jgi:hypothetical protein
MKTFKWIFALVLLMGLSLPTMHVRAACTSAALELTNPPTPNPAIVGSEVTFDLIVNVDNCDAGQGIAGVHVYLSYNPALVSPPSTPGATAVEVRPDFFGVNNIGFSNILTTTCPGGANPCIELVVAGPPQQSQRGIVGRFHFVTLATGAAIFAILPQPIGVGTPYLVNANGIEEQLTEPLPGPITSTITDRTIRGQILRQGQSSLTVSLANTQIITTVIAPPGGYIIPTVGTIPNGTFTLNNLPNGTYKFTARYNGYLDATKTVVITASPVNLDLGTTTLVGGDVDGNNVINILDIGQIIGHFGQSGFPPSEPCDINDDGRVNISDLAIAAGNWNKPGPTVWP